MEGDYNFWADMLDTFQSSPDWIKALWLLIPPAFLLVLFWLWRRPKTPPEMAASAEQGRLLYSVYRDSNNRAHIVSYIPELIGRPDILLIDPPEVDRSGRNDTLTLAASHKDNSEGR